MTNVFIESSTKTSNEYNFLKTLIEQCVGKKEKEDYILITVGGKDNLEKNKSKFSDHTGDAEKNLVIFDADMPENGGGFKQRKKDLTDKLKSMEVQFKLFLFPNNKDDGMFEHLLEQIINPKHKRILDCLGRYEECLDQYKNDTGSHIYQTPNQKTRIYAYISGFKMTSQEKEKMKNRGDWSFGNFDYWNLQTQYLKPLIDFLQKNV